MSEWRANGPAAGTAPLIIVASPVRFRRRYAGSERGEKGKGAEVNGMGNDKETDHPT